MSWRAQYTTGKVQAGEQEVTVLPRQIITTSKVGVISVHGAGATSADFMRTGLTHQVRLNHAMCREGFVITAPDLGGLATWGNDTAVARIEAARLMLVGLGCNPNKIILDGTSMGGLNSLNYTRAYPNNVALVIAKIPVCDLEDIRGLGYGPAIEAAWGIASGAPLPSRANPVDNANAAAIASGGAVIKLYYSLGDAVARPGPVEALAAKLGVTPVQFANHLNHSDAQFEFIPTDDILAAMKAAGA